MSARSSVKVSRKHQIVVPSAARKALGIEAGDRLLVDVQDGILVLVPYPGGIVGALEGLHADIWSGIDAQEWVDAERDAWAGSDSD